MFLGMLLLLAAAVHPNRVTAASAVDNLIDRLPNPETMTKSPLQTALQDPDPILKDPALRQFVVSLKRGDMRKALDEIRPLTERYPRTVGVHFFHGLVALQQGYALEAENAFRQVTILKPDAKIAWHGMALSQASQKRYADAVISERKVIQLDPKLPYGWSTLAMFQYRQGHSQEALAAAQHATEVAPKAVVGWIVQASVRASQKQYPEAVQAYEHALRLAPSNPYLLEGEGVCLAENKQYGAAITPLLQVVNQSRRAYVAMTVLGGCYLDTGKPAEGSALCRRALSVKSDYAPAWKLLGACSQKQGKNRDAVAAFENAVKYAPNDAEARAGLAAATRKG